MTFDPRGPTFASILSQPADCNANPKSPMPARVPILRTTVLAAAVCLPVVAHAHPHVFAEAHLDVVVDAQGHVSVLKHGWRFDDLFSSTVLVEFDKNLDLKLDDEELQAVAETVKASLAEYGYFQLVKTGGKAVEMQAPATMMATFDGQQLVILFESQPTAPIPLAGKSEFGVYDPTFYTAIDYADDRQMAVQGLPATCTNKVVRPDPDEAIAQNQATLTEDFFNDPGGNDLGSIFATRLEIDCPA